MQKITPGVCKGRHILILFSVFFSLAFQPQASFSQEIKHDFKIIGLTRLTNVAGFAGAVSVDYDPDSSDHLLISFFRDNAVLEIKTQFRFTRKKFELSKASEYLISKELLVDGLHTTYREDRSLEKEMLFKDDLLQQETDFYPGGTKQLQSSCDGKILNGEYKVWHPNGQLSFSGNYKNNLKDGEFESFDATGTSIRNGRYTEGKLVSGDATVQDIIHKNPEKPAQYLKGDEGFDEWLQLSSAGLKSLKVSEDEEKLSLDLIVDKTGKINKISKASTTDHKKIEALEAVFKNAVVFIPATVENIPVDSERNLQLLLSKEGLKVFAEKPTGVYLNVDQMPVFKDGLTGMRKFIAMNIRYPVYALQNKIQGKVLVNFVIDEKGDVTNIKIFMGVHSSLDNEAIRVVKLMPRWEPGRMEGKAVKVGYTVPVSFNMTVLN